MKKIQTFTNANLDSVKIVNIFETQPQKGMEAIHVPSYEVSTTSGGIDVGWKFESFAQLEDAQQYALQFIMPKGMLCKIVG
uniref:Uncharacterized protein n=2 Tax=unclassified bacterial viruses TaxID=12333 RepID=A0AAU6VXY2_9VIRU